jgi:hypothetical protein
MPSNVLAEQNRMKYVQMVTEDTGSMFLWNERINII